PGADESRPVPSSLVVKGLYVPQRLLFKIGLGLVSIGPVGAEFVAGPAAYFIVTALIIGDRCEHLLRRILQVQFCCSYYADTNGSDARFLEESQLGHPVGLSYSLLG